MKGQRALRFLPLALLFIVLLFPPIDQTFGAFDHIRPMGSDAPAPEMPWDVLQADSVLQFYVWRDLVFEGYRSGTVPVWNPYALAGTPLLANSQSGAQYPLHVLAGVLGMPTTLAMSALALLHLLIWGSGLARLTRVCGGGTVAELFTLAGGVGMFVLSWLTLPSVVTTIAWIPWAVVGVLPESGTKRAGWMRGVGLVAALGMMATAGHLQFLAYGLMAVGIAWLTSVVMTRRVEGPVLAGLMVSAVMAWVLLRPVLEYSQFSHRRGSPTPEGYAAYLGSALRGWDLATLTHPGVLGNPRVNWLPISETAKASEYWPALVRTGANSAEGATGVGVLLVVGLVALAVLRRAEKASANVGIVALSAILVVASLLAWGSPLNAVLYFGVPGWSATGSPGRVIALLVMAAAVLGAIGLERWVDRAAELTTAQSGGLFATLAIAALWPVLVVRTGLVQLGGAWPAADSPLNREGLLDAHISGLAIGSLLWGLVPAVAIGVAVTLGPARRAVRLAAVLVAALATWVPHAQFQPSKGKPLQVSVDLVSPGQRVAVENSNWELLAAAPAIYPPNVLSGARIAELGGYDSLLHRDTVALLNDVNGQDSAPPANGNMMFIKPGADRAKLAAAGVGAIIRRGPAGAVVEAVDGPGVADLEGVNVPCEFDLRGVRMRLESNPAGKLTVRFRRIGAWRVAIGGREVTDIGTGRWFELSVPANAGDVVLTPVPPMPLGAILAWSVLAILGAVVGFLPDGRSRAAEPSSPDHPVA